jgi:hypothetical protein
MVDAPIPINIAKRPLSGAKSATLQLVQGSQRRIGQSNAIFCFANLGSPNGFG